MKRIGVHHPDARSTLGGLVPEPGSATVARPESGRELVRDCRWGWLGEVAGSGGISLAAMAKRWPAKTLRK
jgi:hypothetical protein